MKYEELSTGVCTVSLYRWSQAPDPNLTELKSGLVEPTQDCFSGRWKQEGCVAAPLMWTHILSSTCKTSALSVLVFQKSTQPAARAWVCACACMCTRVFVCYTWTHGLQCDMTHSQCTAHVPLCRPRENQVKVCFLLFVLIKLHCQHTVSLTENSVTNMASAIDCSNAHRLLRVSKHYLTSATLSQMIGGKTDL